MSSNAFIIWRKIFYIKKVYEPWLRPTNLQEMQTPKNWKNQQKFKDIIWTAKNLFQVTNVNAINTLLMAVTIILALNYIYLFKQKQKKQKKQKKTETNNWISYYQSLIIYDLK